MKYDEFCLNNFYAVELLESLDNGPPTQIQIQHLEKLLSDSNVTLQHTDLQKMIVYDAPEKRALLIEKDPVLQKAHTVLISNFGYHVNVATSKEEVMELHKNRYDVIFTRPYQGDLSGILSTKLFAFNKPTPKIFIYISPEEQDMKEYFSKQGADAVLDLPLTRYLLFDALS